MRGHHSAARPYLPSVQQDSDEIRHLEALADRAWPPGEVAPCDGWELRATGLGIGRRVNSVATFADGAIPLTDRISRAEDFYRQRGLPTTFKLTDASLPADLDRALGAAGYRLDAPTSVRTRALPADPPTLTCRIEKHPSEEWRQVNAAAGEHYGAAPRAFLDLITRIRAPLAFVSITDEGQAAAVGMAVAEAGWVGLFEIGTHPGHRRRGLARQVIAALLAWGAEQKASRAYLQVMPNNTPAMAMYDHLGFVEAYHYWYRVAPADATKPSAASAGAR